jgi:hypothetical protein
MRSEVLTKVNIKITVWWDVILCNMLGTCCLHVQGSSGAMQTWQVPPKYRCLFVRLHGVISEKTTVLIHFAVSLNHYRDSSFM